MKKKFLLLCTGLIMTTLIGCQDSESDEIKEEFTLGEIEYTTQVKTSENVVPNAIQDYSTFQSSAYANSTFGGTESYANFVENAYILASEMAVSTFSADVDTASYSNMRRYLQDDLMPPVDSIRIEELVNYFNYDLGTPNEGETFNIVTEMHESPWDNNHQLLMLAIYTEEIVFSETEGNNLVFLLDVSGSMSNQDKLPLLQQAMNLLVDNLRPTDRLTIVVYAGSSGVVLDGVTGEDKQTIKDAINNLRAGGSTNGSSGIHLAYEKAEEYFVEGGNNRVILCTDGDFNVGTTGTSELETLISEKRETGVYLSVLGFGTGNTKDDIMETLADNGNGVYYYIDSLLEAKKVFVNELGGSLVTVAKDVKFQIEFNPAHVKGYRLIGYENRLLNYEDFDNNEIDAGDIGAGHEVIVFYEIIPSSSDEEVDTSEYKQVPDLKYNGTNYMDEVATLKINYKNPTDDTDLSTSAIITTAQPSAESETFKFASAVVEFGLVLRRSEHQGNATYNNALIRAMQSTGIDLEGYRYEFISLINKTIILEDTQ